MPGFTSIENSLAAFDGGTLVLYLRCADGTQQVLGLNRSMESRGTHWFNKVSWNSGTVPGDQCLELAANLEQLQSQDPNGAASHAVPEFIAALRAQASQPAG